MKVTGAVVAGSGAPFELMDLDLADPGPAEVRVRMVACGVCHTDQVIRDQLVPMPLPAVLGHEGAGMVEAVGPGVTNVAPGDRVVLSFNSCGTCSACSSGAPGYCAEFGAYNFGGGRPDGSTSLTCGGERVSSHFFGQSSFATHATVSMRSVVRVDDEDVPLEILGPLGCGIQTGAGAVLNSLAPEAGSSIAIFGAGAVGDAALLASRVAGCTTIIAVDRMAKRLEFARELGATHTVDVADGDPVAAIMDITAGAGVNYALETTGVPPVLRQAVDSLAIRGVAGLLGQAPIGSEVALETGSSLLRGWSLKAIIEGDSVPQVFIPRLIRLYRAGLFPFDKLIQTFPFAEIGDAFVASEHGEVVKPVLVM
ncbi:NAD(P)-dependent alcohol dehydrogenase [Williamsia sp. CHRR-6]|uniref:NAD(P)-dependent alcohol dehydrogenase n=1 Tax=Williamsia sp. CHRR-6 TaxID=2835871 RepID=UPI001BDA7A14|nr:NAD(P)-dependent alcohol dehydrogenase [Williamsia sp. CHRR-6]MBT0567798.1 NAD(P)-dependent alcohol dehydrogenase [Williamsia sp. CHRR-6]